VLGDGGRLYNGMAEDHVELMRRMVSVAHLAMPNYTEACYLAGEDFSADGLTWAEACRLIDKLRQIGAKSVLITSCRIDGESSVAAYNHYSGEYFHLEYDEIPGIFHGTGDLFAAILMGSLLGGKPLKESTRLAMDVVYKLIWLNRDMEDKNRGILIEKYLDEILPST
ncbi:MAG: bifunctional hydroxymethylpyrimidine kinase/phosphomethylpyrimidine kinase, partial [Prevotella sp.]|nr:bifunctional hydroxymethylpyrimidine kinase/phosphomethylpyrimidine kinase [Prevotella sp.]